LRASEVVYHVFEIRGKWNLLRIAHNLFLIGDPTATAARNADPQFFQAVLNKFLIGITWLIFGIAIPQQQHRLE
jgi:hypothetical protein